MSGSTSKSVKKPVLFRKPENWNEMSDADQKDFCDHILDLMGVPPKSGDK